MRNVFLAILLGGICFVTSASFWGLLVSGSNPVADWLLQQLVAQHISSDAFHSMIYIHDFLLNLLITFPFVYVLSLLRPGGSWSLVAFAAVTFLTISQWPVITDLPGFIEVVGIWGYASSIFMQVAPFIVNFAAIRAKRRRMYILVNGR